MIARARHGPRPARPVHPCAGPSFGLSRPCRTTITRLCVRSSPLRRRPTTPRKKQNKPRRTQNKPRRKQNKPRRKQNKPNRLVLPQNANGSVRPTGHISLRQGRHDQLGSPLRFRKCVSDLPRRFICIYFFISNQEKLDKQCGVFVMQLLRVPLK